MCQQATPIHLVRLCIQGMLQILSLLQNRFVEILYLDHRDYHWHLTDTNWILSSQGDLLMWVLRESQVIEPTNILVISRHGSGSIDFRQAMLGLEWTGCYTP